MRRLLFTFALLLCLPWVTQAQKIERIEPELQGYKLTPVPLDPLNVGTAAVAPDTLIAKYLQMYAIDPICSRKGQLYYNTTDDTVNFCTTPGSPGVWFAVSSTSGGSTGTGPLVRQNNATLAGVNIDNTSQVSFFDVTELPGSTTSGKVVHKTGAAAVDPNTAWLALDSSTWTQFMTANVIAPGANLGAGVNAQTGTTYTVADDVTVISTNDRGKLITFTNAGAIAVTLPQAGTGSLFVDGWFADFQNRGAGTATITPTTSTIDGSASLALTTGQGVRIFSDGTNYFTQRGVGSSGGGTVTSVSVVTANGLSGSVATATTTPAITLDIAALDAAKIADGTVTSAEFQFINSLSSNAQTQLDAKAPLASPTFTGTVTIPTPFTLGAVSVLPTGTELNFVDGVTSNIQTQLNNKQAQPPTVVDGNVTYGCVPDTGADQTSCFQTAINTEVSAATNATATTRVLEFTPGVYTISGALSHDNGAAVGLYNAQITIPKTAYTVSRPFLMIRSKNRAGSHNPYNQATLVTTGNVTFKTTLSSQVYSGTFGTPFMIGGPDAIHGTSVLVDSTSANIHFQGVNFVAPSNPSIGGFNGELVNTVILEDCLFSTTDIALGTSSQAQPTNPTGLSFLMPVNNLDYAELRGRVEVTGWYGGPGISELTQISGTLYSIQNWVALNMQAPWNHGPTLTKAFLVRNPYGLAKIDPSSGPVTMGTARTMIEGTISFEDVLAGNWRTLVNHVNDPGNALYGLINYEHVITDVGNTTAALTLNGGTNLLLYGLGDGFHGRLSFAEGNLTNDTATGGFNFGRSSASKGFFFRSGTTNATAATWSDLFNVIQFGNGASILGDDGNVTPAISSLSLSANAVLAAGPVWKYIGTGAASNYYQALGAHNFRVAASGAAGNNIAWINALTLNADGTVNANGGFSGLQTFKQTGPAIYFGASGAPAAFGSSQHAIQFGNGASIMGDGVGVGAADSTLAMSANAFFDNTNWKYIATGLAANYYQFQGTHNWRVAASGTGGTNISWINALTLNSGGLTIGSGGTAISKHLSATATLDFGNVATIGCTDLTITVTGAALGDTVSVGVPNASIVANSSYSGWVSAADTVTVRFCALISGDPASGTFRADVWRH